MTTRSHYRARNLRAALLACTTGAIAAGPAFAADNSNSTQPATVQEVVVTAQKRTERLIDVPMAVSVVSGSQLTESQSNTLQDVVNHVPGVHLEQKGPAANELVIRGISVGAGVNSSVATYVDEVPYTSAGPFAYSANLAPNLDTYDLARVEVLRGPQGTLYGASALGGLLKYVTNAPDPTRYAASVLAGVSSVDHSSQTGFELHGMVNLPFNDKLALRLVGEDSLFPGYIDNPVLGQKDINSVRRYGGRASLLWDATPDLSVRLSATYQRLKAKGDPSEDISAATLEPIAGDLTTVKLIATPSVVKNQIYNGTINWNLGFATLVSSTSYSKGDPTVVGDLSPTFGPILDGIFGGNFGAEVLTREPVHSFTQEVRLSSHGDQTLEWMVGGYYTDEAAHEVQALYPVDLNTGQVLVNFSPSLGTYYIDSTYRELAGFANATYHFTPAFEVSLGGRYSGNKQSYHQMNDGLFTGSQDFITLSKQDVFTYSADAKYHFTPEAMIYGRIATGFVPGGPNDILPGSTLPESFKSSSTTNYEVGLKGSLLDRRLTYDLDVFDVEWQDIQLIAEVNNLFAITNGGTARSRGIEGGLTLAAAPGLTFSVDAAYTDAKLTEDTPTSFGGKAGDRLPYTPLFAGTVGVNYERPISEELSMFGGVDWHYSGSRLTGFNSGGPRQTLPSYSMVNLRLGLKYQGYTLTGFVKNVGDEKAFSTAGNQTIGGVPALSAIVATPRTFGVTLGAKF